MADKSVTSSKQKHHPEDSFVHVPSVFLYTRACVRVCVHVCLCVCVCACVRERQRETPYSQQKAGVHNSPGNGLSAWIIVHFLLN